MIKPCEEIRVANDALELVLTLRVKHPGLQWAVEALEHKGDLWRVLLVGMCGLGPMRLDMFLDDSLSLVRIAEKVNEALSKF